MASLTRGLLTAVRAEDVSPESSTTPTSDAAAIILRSYEKRTPRLVGETDSAFRSRVLISFMEKSMAAKKAEDAARPEPSISELSAHELAQRLRQKLGLPTSDLAAQRARLAMLSTIRSIHEMLTVELPGFCPRKWCGVSSTSTISVAISERAVQQVGLVPYLAPPDGNGRLCLYVPPPDDTLYIPLSAAQSAQTSQEVRWFNEGRLLVAWNLVKHKLLIDQHEGVGIAEIDGCLRTHGLEDAYSRIEVLAHESDDYRFTIKSATLGEPGVSFTVTL